MSRALSRSLAVVALLAVVSAALIVVTPSLAHIVPHRTHQPSWVWESHVYGVPPAGPAATPQPKTAAARHAKHGRRPYKPPVVRSSQP